MPYKINVPYSDKDLAKSKGAFWDGQLKTWYVPDHKNLNDFLDWIDTANIDVIIKAPFYLGIADSSCWKCHAQIKVIALYSDNFFSLGDGEDEVYFEDAEAKSFFNTVTYLDAEVAAFLTREFPFFKLGFSRTVGEKYWANHCSKCGALQGDFFNHNEPGGAFFPMTEEECRSLTLVKLPFGYDAGLRGSFSFSTNEDEVFDLALKKNWEDLKSGS